MGQVGVSIHFFFRFEADCCLLQLIRMWTSKLHVDPAHVAHADDGKFAKYVSFLFVITRINQRIFFFSAFARIENHYFVNEVCKAFITVYMDEISSPPGIHERWAAA
jgi:hypothetical protein